MAGWPAPRAVRPWARRVCGPSPAPPAPRPRVPGAAARPRARLPTGGGATRRRRGCAGGGPRPPPLRAQGPISRGARSPSLLLLCLPGASQQASEPPVFGRRDPGRAAVEQGRDRRARRALEEGAHELRERGPARILGPHRGEVDVAWAVVLAREQAALDHD